MKRTDELLSLFHKSWLEFSEAWKKARAKTSAKSIHDLRVSTRRLIATLEVARCLTRREDIARLQRRFKKVLKRMGPLRDLQVQLEDLSHVRQLGLINDFKRTLERRERREIDGVRAQLGRGRKSRLSEDMKDVQSGWTGLHESSEKEKIQLAIERALTVRRNAFLKAERRFKTLQPLNEEALHEMRIALKKLRYVVEAAQPVLGDSAKESVKRMQIFQQLLGETRDVEMLRTELEKWAAKRGKTIAVVPALDDLVQKKGRLLKKIMESSTEFEQLLKAETSKPVAEKTHVVSASAPLPDLAGSRSDPAR